MMRRRFSTAAVLFAAAMLGGCTVGPKHQRPAVVPSPPTWKTEAPWQQAAPKDAIPKGAWWTIFKDSELNGYEEQLLKANQSLSAAQSRLQEARAIARISTAGLFPQMNVDAGAQRQRLSGNRPVVGSSAQLFQSLKITSRYPFTVSYEVDLFGRVRRDVEAANASLQATAADSAERAVDSNSRASSRLLHAAPTRCRAKSCRRIGGHRTTRTGSRTESPEWRHRFGTGSGAQANLLDSTRTQLSLVQQQRDQYEHAIAVLTGHSASAFSVPVAPLNAKPPAIPVGVPSDLLERRPDVATEERTMAYQNAQVGIAYTAFYPRITLTGGGGYQSRDITSLLNAPSAVWAIGAD